MPTYEYECTKCGAVTEVFQSITESVRRKLRKKDEPQCDCGAVVHRRIGSGGGLIFKGSGFYETDYRRKDSSRQNDSAEKKDSNTAKKSADSESKSTTKAEPKSESSSAKSQDKKS